IYGSPSWSSVMFTDSEPPHSDFTAVGCLPEVYLGQELTLYGEWGTHEKYGEQFKIQKYEIHEDPEGVKKAPSGGSEPKPTSREKAPLPSGKAIFTESVIVRFLSSQFIKGIGYQKAVLIYAMFGEKTFDVIQKTPEKLAMVSGVSMKMAHSIHDDFMFNKDYLPLRAALDSSVTDRAVLTIYEKYKDRSLHILKIDPYRLIDDIDGFGFKKADKIAAAYGIAEDAPCRIKGAVMHILKKMSVEGHCFSFTESLADHLKDCIGPVENSVALAADAIKSLKDEKRVYVEKDGAIWPIYLYSAEVSVAKRIKSLLSAKRMKVEFKESDIEYALTDVRKTTCFELEKIQRKAVVSVFQHPFSVITGGPGTGKTTIIKAILHVWNKFDSMDSVVMMAPTGKAARRITEVTGFQAFTIHQQTALLHKKDSLEYCRNPEEVGLVIVDEGSMIDVAVADMLLRYVREGTRVVVIGDKDQLPSIGPGNFFFELCRASGIVPKVELRLSFRQKG
ncbi:MAG: AAA family ATPase, partial [Clostridiales bacterium]|nr:AAA family ATPase [Clostridiales bacterium]